MTGERGREGSPLDAQDGRSANDISGNPGAVSPPVNASTVQVSVVQLCVE